MFRRDIYFEVDGDVLRGEEMFRKEVNFEVDGDVLRGERCLERK